MQIIYGTGNPAKLKWMQRALEGLNIELISLSDAFKEISEVAEAPENRNTPLENARQKAEVYYRVFHKPVFSCDSGLYIEGIPDEIQPGVHVRRVKDKILNDDEMIAYYGGLAKKYGDLKARYWNAVCLIMNEDEIYEQMDESISGALFILTSKPHKKVIEGFPLDSLAVNIETGQYYYDEENVENEKPDVEKNMLEMEGIARFFRRILNPDEEDASQGNGCSQYQTAQKLNQRISLHDKYSENREGFGNWIRRQYQLPQHGRILELGCGTGLIWKDARLPESTTLYLTDFSEGMLEEAKGNLGTRRNICYEVVNIQLIPYEDESFDMVIANMMLYHAPDLDQALQEVKRVLKKGGTFYCATYGERGIPAWLSEVFAEYLLDSCPNYNFTLQNGEMYLKKYFNSVELRLYPDALNVTETADLAEYILSMDSMQEIKNISTMDIMGILDKKKVNGAIHIPKEYGMFLAIKE